MLRTLALAASVLALSSCMTASDPAGMANAGFDARIIRDAFGVPHIYGKRNADVAFGLAYAHAEDDWKNIEEVIRSSRGTLSEIVGDSGAKSDDFILALGMTAIVARDYDTQTSAKAKSVAEGYAAGLNYSVQDYFKSLNRLKAMRDLEGAEILMAHDGDQYKDKGGRWVK
jgi:acyl-homoserine lactone acylase PvdQ